MHHHRHRRTHTKTLKNNTKHPAETLLGLLKKHPRINARQQDGKAKKQFEKLGRAVLKDLAETLLIPDARVVYSVAGDEVSGSLTLKGMFTPDKGVFIQLCMEGVPDTVVYRALHAKSDKVGGPNQYFPIGDLLRPAAVKQRVFDHLGLDPARPFSEQTNLKARFAKGDRVYHAGQKSPGTITEVIFGYYGTNLGQVGYRVLLDNGELKMAIESMLKPVDKYDRAMEETYTHQNPTRILGTFEAPEQQEEVTFGAGDLVAFTHHNQEQAGLILELDRERGTVTVPDTYENPIERSLDEITLIAAAHDHKKFFGVTVDELKALKAQGHLRWPLKGIIHSIHELLVPGVGNRGNIVGQALKRKFYAETGAYVNLQNELLLLPHEPDKKQLEQINFIGRLILAGGYSEEKLVGEVFRDGRYRVVKKHGPERWPLVAQFQRGDLVWVNSASTPAIVDWVMEDWTQSPPRFAYAVMLANGTEMELFDRDLQPARDRLQPGGLEEHRTALLAFPPLRENETHYMILLHQEWNREQLMRELQMARIIPHQHVKDEDGLWLMHYHVLEYADALTACKAAIKHGAVPVTKRIYQQDTDPIDPPFQSPFRPFPEIAPMTEETTYARLKPKQRFSEVTEVERALITVKPELFQGRQESYSQDTVDRILREGFDKSEDPIVVWKDETGQYVVLSGHSRWEASERLYQRGDKSLEYMPVKFFEGSQAEAMDYALLESNRGITQEGLQSDLGAYKRAIERGYNRDYLKGLFKPESRLRLLEDIAHLNESGSILKFLGTTSEVSFPYLQRNAQWIGSIRKVNPELTNAHEEEMFAYLYPTDDRGKADAKRRITISKDKFFQTVDRRINRIDFDPADPLNLHDVISTSAVTDPLREQIEEIEAEVRKLTTERDKKDGLIARAKREASASVVKLLQKRQAEINDIIQQKLVERQKLEQAMGRLERTTIDLFHQEEPDPLENASTEDKNGALQTLATLRAQLESIELQPA